MRETFSEADNFATQVEDLLRKEFPDATPEKLGAAGQVAFTAMAVAKRDSKEFMDLESLRLAKETAVTKGRQKDQDLKLSERRVKLMERKIAQATDALKDGALSPAEREARMKQIFGIV